jgi:hypothetical protein
MAEGRLGLHYTFSLHDIFLQSHKIPGAEECKPNQTDCFTVLGVDKSLKTSDGLKYLHPDFFAGCGHEGNQDMWYPSGCVDQVQMWFVERLHIVGIVGLVVAFIQVKGFLQYVVVCLNVQELPDSA